MTPALKRLCEVTSALTAKVRNEIRKLPANSPAKLVTLYWFAKAAKSYEAALLLWNQGYWQDAAMIGRTILEVSLQARYFTKDPAKFAQQFFEHGINQRNSLFKEFRKFADKEIKTNIEEFFQKENINPSSIKREKNWWGRNETIWDLVGEIGAESTYRSQYGPLSDLVHGSPLGFQYYIFGAKGVGLVDWKASAPRRGNLLASTMFSAAPSALLDVIVVLAEIWGLDYEAELSAASDAAVAFKEETI